MNDKIWIASVRLDAKILADAGTHASALTKAVRSAIDNARSDKNPNLTEHGRKQNELAFREAAKTDLANLASRIASARTYLADKAREHSRVADDAAALIRSEQKWRHVERMLDAGQDLREVLRSADAETARAIAEFGPSWSAAQDYRPAGLGGAIARWMGETPQETADIVRNAVYTRLSQIDPNPEARELFSAAAIADAQADVASPWLNAATSITDGRGYSPIDTAAAAQFAQQRLAAATEALGAPTDAA